MEVSLYKAGGAELGTLQVGRSEGDVTYVRLKSSQAIYAVDGKLLTGVKKAPTEIPG
jgi:hypothetical protein